MALEEEINVIVDHFGKNSDIISVNIAKEPGEEVNFIMDHFPEKQPDHKCEQC